MTVCDNCGAPGPLERVVFGRLMPVLKHCAHGPVFKDARGDEHGQGTIDCLKRRDAIDAARWGGRGTK